MNWFLSAKGNTPEKVDLEDEAEPTSRAGKGYLSETPTTLYFYFYI